MALLRSIRALAGVALVLPLLGAVPAGAATLDPAPTPAMRAPDQAEPRAAALARTLRYDASRAGEFRAAVDRGAQIWNQSVVNVRLVAGTPADFTVVVDNGWPRAQVTSLGRGRIWMGRQAVNEGHNPTRIAAHEIGHILGLPDRRTGLCADLMSGASAGTSCTNPYPNARERAQVDRNFAGSRTATIPARVYVDAPAG